MKHTVSIRLPEELHREIKAVSAKTGISMSKYIEEAVTEKLKSDKNRKAGGKK